MCKHALKQGLDHSREAKLAAAVYTVYNPNCFIMQRYVHSN